MCEKGSSEYPSEIWGKRTMLDDGMEVVHRIYEESQQEASLFSAIRWGRVLGEGLDLFSRGNVTQHSRFVYFG